MVDHTHIAHLEQDTDARKHTVGDTASLILDQLANGKYLIRQLIRPIAAPGASIHDRYLGFKTKGAGSLKVGPFVLTEVGDHRFLLVGFDKNGKKFSQYQTVKICVRK